jgi:hypothetical protein
MLKGHEREIKRERRKKGKKFVSQSKYLIL